MCLFFFQAEDGIRDYKVTGVQTCALPIWNEDAPICVCTRQPLRSSAWATLASKGLSKSPWLPWCDSASARGPRSANSRKCLRSRTPAAWVRDRSRSEEHTSELQSPCNLVCRLLLEKKKHQSSA